jgi:preprotein translocase subunit SecG
MYMRGFDHETYEVTNMTFALYLFMTLFIFICCFLVLLVLIQKGRGGGLSGAFGGAGGNTAFGSKTGDVLTWVTSVVFGIFLLLAIAVNLIADARQTRLTGVSPVTAAADETPTSGSSGPAAPAPPAVPGTQVPSPSAPK